MERFIAFLLLILFSPLLLIAYLGVKLTSNGPFIFRQKRMGKNQEPFKFLKIRVMYENAEKEKEKIKHLNEAEGPVFKIRNDPRLTPFGKLLSRSGFDEILQLVNIIKGEMSFVGSRPLPVSEAKRIPKKYQSRFSIKPGITSLWIIRGAHALTFEEWMESDLEYIKKKNLVLDVFIVLMTGLLMLRSFLKEILHFK